MQSVAAEVSESEQYESDDWQVEIQAVHEKMMETLNRLQRLAAQRPGSLSIEESILFQQRALTSLSAASEDSDETNWLNEIDWKAFGLRLVQRRDAARMHQKELAALLDVTTQTIRNLEIAARRPSRDLLFRLLAIPELKLQISDITGEENKPTLIPTSWLAPQYDPHKMLTDLIAKLNGTGDALEQTTAYLDSRSAADWLSFSLSPGTLAVYGNTLPLHNAAEHHTKHRAQHFGDLRDWEWRCKKRDCLYTVLCRTRIYSFAHTALFVRY